MKVRFKDHMMYNFDFKEGDYVTVVVNYLTVKELASKYYHGTLTQIEEDNSGFWCVLDDDKTKEEFFSFADLENVIPGDRIPFLGGTSKRIGY